MRSTFHNLETVKRSLFTHQAALATTGHNVANANTIGYSRQVVNMRTSLPIEAAGMQRTNIPGQLGTGVEFSSITRVRQQFLDDQFRNEVKHFGSWYIRADSLEKLEGIVNEPSDTGLRTVIDNFWKSWSDLSKDAENPTSRRLVKESAIALVDAFNFTSKQLNDLSSDLTRSIEVRVTEINSIADQIASLNDQIKKIEAFGDNANDLRDQRDVLADELAQIGNITVQEGPQGYTITLAGANLVDGGAVTPVTADGLAAAYATGALDSGEVHGMFESRQRYVVDYQRQLDEMANTLANGEITITIPEGSVLPDNAVVNRVMPDGTVQQVTLTGDARVVGEGGMTIRVNGLNGLHQLGYTMGEPLEKGIPFFTSRDGGPITAANIQLNPDIAANPDKIASSLRTTGPGQGESVIKGNNTLATLINNLKDTAFKFPGDEGTTATIGEFYGSMVGQLGVQSKEAKRYMNNQMIQVSQIDSRRHSVSGVSLDEEMANMIKFQHAYTAAARVMTSFDEMLDKIINGMGIVGR
ncbi:flagellar hook-associated protein FlgK [Paenibacillus senegalensis]|uniref:flagellar hook-associated protein FlgK n=1 Tax=Paenibacillus senegalensis TaxID=1465766 RepID=UPI0002881F27|nr:flagellar hook-associated protein FlgK [Paenibacillus senegalensis]